MKGRDLFFEIIVKNAGAPNESAPSPGAVPPDPGHGVVRHHLADLQHHPGVPRARHHHRARGLGARRTLRHLRRLLHVTCILRLDEIHKPVLQEEESHVSDH